MASRAKGRSVLLWRPEGSADRLEEELSLRLALTGAYGGNDFRTGRPGQIPWRARSREGHLQFVLCRVEDALGVAGLPLDGEREVLVLRSAYDERPWKAMLISGQEFEELAKGVSGAGDQLWLACGMLPRFMDIEGYGK